MTNTQISEFVPKDQVSILTIFSLYDQGPAVQNVDGQDFINQPTISKIKNLKSGIRKWSRNFHKCFYLGEKLGINIQNSHSLEHYPRQYSIINMIQSEDNAFMCDDNDDDYSQDITDNNKFNQHNVSLTMF